MSTAAMAETWTMSATGSAETWNVGPSLLLRLFLFEVVYDLLFYWSHRLCHTKLLYQAVHKAHHRHRHGLTLLSTIARARAQSSSRAV